MNEGIAWGKLISLLSQKSIYERRKNDLRSATFLGERSIWRLSSLCQHIGGDTALAQKNTSESFAASEASSRKCYQMLRVQFKTQKQRPPEPHRPGRRRQGFFWHILHTVHSILESKSLVSYTARKSFAHKIRKILLQSEQWGLDDRGEVLPQINIVPDFKSDSAIPDFTSISLNEALRV